MLTAISQSIQHNLPVSQQNLADTSQRVSNLEKNDKDAANSEATQQATAEISQKDLQKISQLKQRDQEVKAHEQAHLSAAGAFAIGGPSFTYQSGPDGVRYAIGGEVNISTSPIEGDPAATLQKADAIRRAALAPANPSSQDHMVAAKAAVMAEKARVDLANLSQQMDQEKESKVTKKEQINNDESQVKSKGELTSSNTPEPTPTLGALLDLSV